MRLTVLFAVFATAPNQAGADAGGLYNGHTLGSGGKAIGVEAGWPGIGARALFGVATPLDLGLKLESHFAGLGTYETDGVRLNYGMDLVAVVRAGIVRTDSVSFLVRVEPGFRFSQFSPLVAGGPLIDLAGDLGIRLSRRGSLYVGVEAPLFFGRVNYVDVLAQIPILPGAGYEYAMDRIGFGARVNAGPSIAVGGGLNTTSFAFIGQGFFFVRWDKLR